MTKYLSLLNHPSSIIFQEDNKSMNLIVYPQYEMEKVQYNSL